MPAPASHAHCQALLAEALQLARLLRDSPSPEQSAQSRHTRWQNRLRELQRELEQYAHPICREPHAVPDIPHAIRLAFVKATVLSTHYSASGQGWRGTLHSPTLDAYTPDDISPQWRTDTAIEDLCRAFQLDASDRSDIQTILHTVEQNFQQQRSLITALLHDSQLQPTLDSAPCPRCIPKTNHILQLFQVLFGTIPLPLAALDCIYTDSQLYFCIDYEGDRLSDLALWNQLTYEEQQTLSAFLSALSQFSFESFRRFPTFGACHPGQINTALCDRLSVATGLPPSDIRTRISRTTGVIPTAKAEAFLLHDIWGHNWQFMLTSFISDYDILAYCDEPLRARETAYTPHGPLSCSDLFTVQNNTVALQEEQATLFFHGEVQQRLGLLFTHLLGELVADVAEFKFIWDAPHAADALLSSSLFKNKPAKLDLGLADVDFLFLKVLQPLLSVQLSVMEETRLEHDLLEDWRTQTHEPLSLELKISLKQAIARLYEIFLREYGHTYLPTLNGEPRNGEPSLFADMVSNLLYLQNAINELYTDLPSNSSLPFQDLLILFIGAFCSHDSYAEFWDVDNAIASYFVPCWGILNQMHAVSA
ncbi:MAG: hypothetical protein VKL39_10465 [Leptolyngbyaceae bacterium]|nr:hypothetical protein [Leptolyngbyaceae bacterium]